MTISEKEFHHKIRSKLNLTYPHTKFKSVTGPGRSGAIASAYASHILGVPWFPHHGSKPPDELRPILVIDTATQSGRTLRRAMRDVETGYGIAVYVEPPRVRFWYERTNVVEYPSEFCPICNTKLVSFRCKLVCSVCGYFMSCAEFD